MEAKSKILLLICLIGLSSCSMLDRRDFYSEMGEDQFAFDEPMFKPYDDFPVVPGDNGRFMEKHELMGRVPATAAMREESRFDSSISKELYNLESRLSDVQYEEYMQVKGQLGSDYERIYYLRLHPGEKGQYLSARGIETKRYYTAHEAMRGPASTDLTLGMRKTDVLNYWGQPDRRDYSGDPMQGNERWAYSRNGQTKYIYFESGQVEGWSVR